MTTENQAPEGADAALLGRLDKSIAWLRDGELTHGNGLGLADLIAIRAALATQPAGDQRSQYCPICEARGRADQPQAALAYQQANPLGGPAKVFHAMATAIEAGDSYEATLRRYGYAEAAQPALPPGVPELADLRERLAGIPDHSGKGAAVPAPAEGDGGEALAKALHDVCLSASSLNSGPSHRIEVNGEPVYWQREEWIRWMLDEVLPDARKVLNAHTMRAKPDTQPKGTQPVRYPHPDEDDAVTLWAEIHRLRAAVQGPDGYATWQEAATAERVRRVAAEKALAASQAPAPAHAEDQAGAEMLLVRVAEDLKRALKAAGLRQCDVACRLGVSEAEISNRLSGERNLTLSTLREMAGLADLRVIVSFKERSNA